MGKAGSSFVQYRPHCIKIHYLPKLVDFLISGKVVAPGEGIRSWLPDRCLQLYNPRINDFRFAFQEQFPAFICIFGKTGHFHRAVANHDFTSRGF